MEPRLKKLETEFSKFMKVADHKAKHKKLKQKLNTDVEDTKRQVDQKLIEIEKKLMS